MLSFKFEVKQKTLQQLGHARTRSARGRLVLLRTHNLQLKTFSVRGTSGDLRHPRRSRYRCSLPGLAGFAGPRCTEPEVPRSGSRAAFDEIFCATAGQKFNTALRALPKVARRATVKELRKSRFPRKGSAGMTRWCGCHWVRRRTNSEEWYDVRSTNGGARSAVARCRRYEMKAGRLRREMGCGAF